MATRKHQTASDGGVLAINTDLLVWCLALAYVEHIRYKTIGKLAVSLARLY